MIRRCDLVPQYLAYKDEIDHAIRGVLNSGRYILAENVAAFEKEFANYIGTNHGIGVNSGTDALMMALWMCNLKAGDEVVTTPFTAIPTYSAIRHVGAKPVFVDVEPDTFLMDLKKVKTVLSGRTKVIVAVHLFGNAINIEELRESVGSKTYIIEDCAQAHGATINGKKAGSFGDFGAFSFYPTKNLGGYGDGGMITTNREDAAETIKKRRMYGMTSKDEFDIDGVNTRLDEIQAAILRVKLKYLDVMNKRRMELASLYRTMLPAEYIKPQKVRNNIQSVYHVYCSLCKSHRDDLISFLMKKNIQTNVYYTIPLSRQKGYINIYGEGQKMVVSEEVSRQIIALPFYPEMGEETIEKVSKAISEYYN